jgi:uncharacterized protein YggT (Ycf19 family)
MGLIDSILNLVALLLWFNWRTARLDPLAGSTPATLAGTLRRAGKPELKHWLLPLSIPGLLLLRALFYWQIGGALGWTGRIDLGVVAIPFWCDSSRAGLWRMLLFSAYSFGVALAIFSLWLLLLSILKARASHTDSLRQLLRAHLGLIEVCPWGLKLLLPVLILAPVWWLASWPLTSLELLPPPASATRRLQQSLLVGAGSYLGWKYLIAAVLLLYFVANYVYFGRHPFWQHLNEIGRRLLTPLRWLPLRISRLDLSPVIGIVIVFLLAQAVEHGVRTSRRFDAKGVELRRMVEIPGLVDLYRRVSS